jgi:hypothetical protein
MAQAIQYSYQPPPNEMVRDRIYFRRLEGWFVVNSRSEITDGHLFNVTLSSFGMDSSVGMVL